MLFLGLDSTAGLKNDLIEILESKYLINESIRSGSRWFELTHDRLIKPIVESNKKWENEQRKNKKLKIIRIVVPSAISVLVFIVIFTLK